MSAFFDSDGRKLFTLVRGPGPVMIIELADVYAGWLTAHEVVHFLRKELEKRVK